MTDTTQSTGQVVASAAVQTLQALLPTLLTTAATGLSAPQLALLTLLPTFVHVAETMKSAGSATPEQLATMWTALTAGVQDSHDRLQADLRKLGIAPLPATPA